MKKIVLLALLLLLFILPAGEQVLATEYNPYRIEINLDRRLLYVYENEEKVLTYSVAIGKAVTPSPIGDFRIVNKQVHWNDRFGTRWMGLNVPWGTYGVHGTNRPSSITTAASHGCIRLFNHDVEQLYNLVPVGTRVRITGEAWRVAMPTPGAAPGTSGQEIVFLQQKLNETGFWCGFADGHYGQMTQNAIKYLQAFHHLPQTGIVDEAVLSLLYPK